MRLLASFLLAFCLMGSAWAQDGVNVNINFSVPGMPGGSTGVNANVQDNTQQPAQTQQPVQTAEPAPAQPVSRCMSPMSGSELDRAVNQIKSGSFSETMLKTAKQVVRSKCFTTGQLKRMMGAFSFEKDKLDLAKFAYQYVMDPDNYYELNDAFSFSSSQEELMDHINGGGGDGWEDSDGDDW